MVNGAVGGSVVQARDIHGDVHVHAPGLTVPRQLPRGGAKLVGHEGELDGLNCMARVTVISGMAGVGKTALCLHWARSIGERFPDGQLYVDMRGFDPSPPAVGPCGRGQELPRRVRGLAGAHPAGHHLAGQPLSQHCREPKGPGGAGQRARRGAGSPVVAHRAGLRRRDHSRTELTGLLVDSGVHRAWLGLLDEPDARALVASRIAGALATDDAVGDLASMCAGHR